MLQQVARTMGILTRMNTGCGDMMKMRLEMQVADKVFEPQDFVYTTEFQQGRSRNCSHQRCSSNISGFTSGQGVIWQVPNSMKLSCGHMTYFDQRIRGRNGICHFKSQGVNSMTSFSFRAIMEIQGGDGGPPQPGSSSEDDVRAGHPTLPVTVVQWER